MLWLVPWIWIVQLTGGIVPQRTRDDSLFLNERGANCAWWPVHRLVGLLQKDDRLVVADHAFVVIVSVWLSCLFALFIHFSFLRLFHMGLQLSRNSCHISWQRAIICSCKKAVYMGGYQAFSVMHMPHLLASERG